MKDMRGAGRAHPFRTYQIFDSHRYPCERGDITTAIPDSLVGPVCLGKGLLPGKAQVGTDTGIDFTDPFKDRFRDLP